jgi:hypothetical protein
MICRRRWLIAVDYRRHDDDACSVLLNWLDLAQ